MDMQTFLNTINTLGQRKTILNARAAKEFPHVEKVKVKADSARTVGGEFSRIPNGKRKVRAILKAEKYKNRKVEAIGAELQKLDAELQAVLRKKADFEGVK